MSSTGLASIDPAAARTAGGRVSPAGWALLAAIVVTWFATLAMRHLLPSDEGRYAEIAREMFTSGDWVTIRYDGLKYFEKPPLHLWATALAYSAFGVGDWQARLWVGLCGAGGIVVSAATAWRLYGQRVALLSGCALLGMPAWIVAGHVNSLDMGVAFMLTCVLACFLMSQRPDAQADRLWWICAAWAAMGAAVLAKGLIGIVLPGLAVAVYMLVTRDWALVKRLHIVAGSCVLLIVAAPWFVLVSLRNPEFPQFFFIHEHWQRYTSGIHHRGGAWWYFVPQILIGFLPWLGLVPRIVAVVRGEPRDQAFRPALFLCVWAVMIFLFFSLSGSKLPGYIIPLYPALAILAGIALDRVGQRAWARQVVGLAVVASVGLLATPFVARLGDEPETMAGFHAFAPWLAAAFAWGLVCLGIAYRLNRHDTGASIVATSIAFFGVLSIALLGHESFGASSSGFALAREARWAIEPGMPFYSVRLLDHTVPFYMRRTTVPVAWPDELEFGIRQEPDKWLPTIEDFKHQWLLPVHAGALMSHETFAALRQQGLVMFPVVEDSRRVVVTNFARPLGAHSPPVAGATRPPG